MRRLIVFLSMFGRGLFLPLGPEIDYADQKSDPVELRVYPGADGEFDLYEDEGDNYNYEKGAWAVIPIRWDDRTHTLTIKARQGSFPNMIQKRRIEVVLVSANRGSGGTPTKEPDAVLEYDGSDQMLKLPLKATETH